VAETRRDLERMLDLTDRPGWRPPIVATTAPTGEGVDELWASLRAHRDHLESTGQLEPRRAARVGDELVRIVAVLLRERALAAAGDGLHAAAVAVHQRTVDPWTAAEGLLPD
jgi:LAO/AO transport system kinase